jgi:uncharacterized membrane protein
MKEYYYLFYSFIIYAFLGWVLEVMYHIYTDKKFINRGFLFGPICPIYGVSAVFFIAFLTPLKSSSILIFLGGVFVASAVEFVTGYVMEMLFKAKWWDYSDERFNIKGYICLKFSIIWGVIALVFMKVIDPQISKLTYWIISQFGEVLYNILLIVLIVDIVHTINSLIAFKQLYIELQEILVETRNNMDKLKETFEAETRASIEERINYLGDLKERISKRISMRQKYLLRAYPRLQSKRFNSAIDDIKKRIEKINLIK